MSQLEALVSVSATAPADTPAATDAEDRIGRSIRLAGYILDFRDQRRKAFPDMASMFDEPAWDLVLHLFLANVRGEELTISELEKRCGIPHTTAYRYKQSLIEDEWIEQRKGRSDARRQPLSLKARRMSQFMEFFANGLFEGT